MDELPSLLDPVPANAGSASVSPGEAMLVALLESGRHLHPDEVGDAADEAARIGGFGGAEMWLVDLDQRLLNHVPHRGRVPLDPQSVDGTLAGRCFRTQTTVSAPHPSGQGTLVWTPLVDGAERVGVMGIHVLGELDEITRRRCDALASLIGEITASKVQYGDGLVLRRRSRPLNLAAELRWALLPPLTYTDGHVAITGILEPAYEIAGDAFDYAINDDATHIAILDAMGHGLEASRMANLALAAYRNARRTGADLIGAYAHIDRAISEQFGAGRFVTGQLAQLDADSGDLRWLNAGHPRPLIVRGQSTFDLPSAVCLPLGLGEIPAAIEETSLEPGDICLFFTDGLTEARSPEGELFGRDRLSDLLGRAALADEPLSETARRLCHAVLEHQEGRLQDDATLLLVRWAGPRRTGTPASKGIADPAQG